eukprot:840311-Alexandrium_andersonii.AAC.1
MVAGRAPGIGDHGSASHPSPGPAERNGAGALATPGTPHRQRAQHTVDGSGPHELNGDAKKTGLHWSASPEWFVTPGTSRRPVPRRRARPPR